MAAVLNFDWDEGPSRAQADAAMAVVLDHVSHLPARLAVPLLGRFRTQFDAAEARALATVIDVTGNTKVAESIAGKSGKTSKAARRRSAKRAVAVKANSALADKMDNGDLSGDQVELLADAAEKTEGASLTDDALIDQVAAVDADQGKAVIDDHVTKTSSSDKEQSRHDKQRRKRRASRYRTKDGCDAVQFAGDRETIDEIWAFVTRRSNVLFQRDGGRDVPQSQRPRSDDQRRFDAAASFFTATPDAKAATDHGPLGGQPGDGSSRCDPSKAPAQAATPSKRYTPKLSTTRPVILVGVTLDKLAGLDHDQAAQAIGNGPIADSVLAQYLDADPDIIGAIFDNHGQPLWLGRQTRLASHGQIIALIVRDKGCVLCAAHHSRCQAHHTMPWTSPGQGRTDIDQLALVCQNCHGRLHDNEQTLYKDRHTSKWTLRPALPHELPAKRPPRPNNGQAPLLT